MKLEDVLIEQAAAAGKIEQAASTAAAIGQAIAEPTAAAGAGWAGGKALSKILQKSIPGVGTGLSLYDAYTRYQNGDYSGAVVATLAGAAYLFGPVGAVAGTALELGNLGKDFLPPPDTKPRGARGAPPQKEALNPSLSFEEMQLMDPEADADMDARAVAWGKAWQAGQSTYKDPATGEIKATVRQGAPKYGSPEAFAKFNTTDKFYSDLERLNALMKAGTKITDPALRKLIPGAGTPRTHPKTGMVLPESALDEDWQKVNKRDKTSGMSRKAVKAYRRENPGSKLQTAVTTKPSKLKKGSKSAKRRKSFCARMSGMKKSRASAKTKRDPNSPINKALRRWNCESVEDMRNLVKLAEEKLAVMRIQRRLTESLHMEAGSPAQQAAIAIAMKKAGKTPKSECKDPNEYDMEGDYAKTQLQTIERMARILKARLRDEENLPEWVQTKLARAESMLVTVTDYLISQQERSGDMMQR